MDYLGKDWRYEDLLGHLVHLPHHFWYPSLLFITKASVTLHVHPAIQTLELTAIECLEVLPGEEDRVEGLHPMSAARYPRKSFVEVLGLILCYLPSGLDISL